MYLVTQVIHSRCCTCVWAVVKLGLVPSASAVDTPNRLMTLRLRSFFIASLLALAATPCVSQDTSSPDDGKARKMVEDADRIRFPGEGFQVDIAIVTTGEGKMPELCQVALASKV